MINDLTQRINSTCSHTRINTFQVCTSFVRWAIRVDNTLRSTSNQRITIIIFEAYTSQNTVLLTTFSIRTALNSITCYWLVFDYRTVYERISIKSLRACTKWIVIYHRTYSISCRRSYELEMIIIEKKTLSFTSTNTRTRILTFITYTCFIEWTICVR